MGFAPASKDFSVSVKSVFSAAAGAASSSSAGGGGAAAAGPAEKPPMGRSGILRVDWEECEKIVATMKGLGAVVESD